MGELPELELRRTALGPTDMTRPESARRTGLWLLAVLLAALIGTATYIVFRRQPPTISAPQSVSKPQAAAPPEAERSLGGEAEPIAIPPLDQTDPLVRTLVR